MKIIDKRLRETADIIDRKFSKVNEENRSEISTDILPHMRHFCEAFMYKVYDEENSADLYQTQENLKIVRLYMKQNYYEIDKFHSLLDSSVGHMDFGPMQSEALTIKYVPKLILLKHFLLKKYGISVFENIDKYPLDLDQSIVSFYEKILFVLLHSEPETKKMTRNQYFVRKRSMKYIDGHIFYEYVFDVSDDKKNKYNTFVCYSFKNIRFDYDLKLLLSKKQITYLNTKIIINVIYDYEYSIRPCTFKNLLYLINVDNVKFERDREYSALMRFIKQSNRSLVDIIDSDTDIGLKSSGYYYKFITYVKNFIRENNFGTKIIRLLLSDMRNSTIKAQTYIPHGEMPLFNEKFNGLRIRLASKSFELMPFAFFPKEARPSLYTLFTLYDASDSDDEILYYYMVQYINQNNSAYGIYNNLNGKIAEIKDKAEDITFKIELYDQLNYVGSLSPEIEVIEEDSRCYAIVQKMKYYNDKYDSDMDTRTKLPFQISYAMSIHKAQGLEFDSVKIVITKEADELVTKNIFYTAVTRAKKKLKIYWQPEVANYVLENIENSVDSKHSDLSILMEQMKEII